ncbi:MAG TPA: class I SAM-dependent methyltransferase [Anaerolineae bacterium]|nr:class I SAM-dependent methyltransferase [Anaerolineae bacterium]
MDIREYNRSAWDKQVERGNIWTQPVSPDVIANARRGEWSVLLTEQKPVPREWFPPMQGADVLCLASGGGQQAPIFAAAGAHVTVLDNSPKQLGQDRFVAEREGLSITTIEGDARDLSMLADESFDLVFHPVSNLFIPEIRPVWREAFRVLRCGGILLAGFMNPAIYLFSYEALDGKEPLIVKNRLPYSDIQDLPEAELKQLMSDDAPFEYSHSLTDQLGGQLDAGFYLIALYEDYHQDTPLSEYMPTYIATRAIKP